MTPPPDRSEPDAETLRHRLKKVRNRVQNTERRLERAEKQLDALRAFSYDVFPAIEVPDRVARVIEGALEQDPTGLSAEALRSLAVCVLEAEASGRAGLVIEAGTARGSAAVTMAAAKDPARPMRVNDTSAVDEPVALAHLDADSSETTTAWLERIAPHLVPDGRIVIDDYWASSDCRNAVDGYFADRSEFRVELRARVHVVRVG